MEHQVEKPLLDEPETNGGEPPKQVALEGWQKQIRDDVIKVVMAEINPLLEKMKKASESTMQNSAASQAQQMENGINEKINKRRAQIQSFIASREY